MEHCKMSKVEINSSIQTLRLEKVFEPEFLFGFRFKVSLILILIIVYTKSSSLSVLWFILHKEKRHLETNLTYNV